MLMLALVLIILSVVFLAWYLVHSDRGAKEPKAALWEAFGFGLVAVALALLLEWPLGGLNTQVVHHQLGLGGTLFLALAIGLIEETCKFLPLAIFIRGRNYFNEHTDGIIYFALAGLAFGLIENLLFLLGSGTQVALHRLELLLFFHAATAGIVGYYFAKAKLEDRSLFQTGLALLGVALLHGLYDFGLFSGLSGLVLVSLLVTAGLNVALFVFFQRGTAADQSVGLSAVGHNQYCRHCGWPNSEHLLFCEHCGAKT